MTKETFKQYVKEGLDRDKEFMVVKFRLVDNDHSRVLIVRGRDMQQAIREILNITDDDMVYSGGRITDVLFTSNLNDLSWFAY